MKRKYDYVERWTVRDAKAMAKILIRHTYSERLEVTEEDVQPICYTVCRFFDCRYLQFILDFREWISKEVVKFNQKLESKPNKPKW